MNMNRTIGGGAVGSFMKEVDESMMDNKSYNFSNQNLNDISFREQKGVMQQSKQ